MPIDNSSYGKIVFITEVYRRGTERRTVQNRQDKFLIRLEDLEVQVI